MRNKKVVLVILLLVTASGVIFGYVIGGSNLSLSRYPSFSAFKPSAPYYSYNTTISKWKYDSYKADVERYIDEAKRYIENADYDIDRISEAKKEVVRQANSVVDEYNKFIKSVKVEY